MTNQIIRQPLYQLEEILKPYHFVRIGKSFIVNISKIRYIRTAFNAKLDIELTTGTHLEVSRSFVKDFKNALGIQKKED
ncbi:MAG: LytTR family DNA-binding domain-containing protein [Bacillota bacterium]